MHWLRDLQFEGSGSGRPAILVDADTKAATSPVELLLLAAATCTASDVVIILQQQRVKLALAAGPEAGRAAARAQLTVQVLVNSAARSGLGLYAGLGAAFSARHGTPGQGFLAVLLGFEAAPGRRQAWYAELGFAGGVW